MMSKSTRKLNIKKALTDGLTIPWKNPSLFLASVVNSILLSLFMFYTLVYYQVGEEPISMQAITGALTWAEFVIVGLLQMLLGIFLYSILTKMAYDSLSGKPDIARAVSLSLRKFLPLLAGYVLYTLLAGVGTILLLVPGLYLVIKLVYFTCFIILDDNGIIESLKSSWKLVKGNWWRSFVLFLIWMVPVSIISAMSVPLSRAAETSVTFVALFLFTPWSVSSFVSAYLQLKVEDNSLEQNI